MKIKIIDEIKELKRAIQAKKEEAKMRQNEIDQFRDVLLSPSDPIANLRFRIDEVVDEIQELDRHKEVSASFLSMFKQTNTSVFDDSFILGNSEENRFLWMNKNEHIKCFVAFKANSEVGPIACDLLFSFYCQRLNDDFIHKDRWTTSELIGIFPHFMGFIDVGAVGVYDLEKKMLEFRNFGYRAFASKSGGVERIKATADGQAYFLPVKDETWLYLLNKNILFNLRESENIESIHSYLEAEWPSIGEKHLDFYSKMARNLVRNHLTGSSSAIGILL